MDQKLSESTITHCYDIFNRLVLGFYISKLDCILLDEEVEIGESHFYNDKKSYAPHRVYALNSVWLFGVTKRNSKDLIIVPVSNRIEDNLLRVICNFIKVGKTIYSDCFSSYVDICVIPKKSKLTQYQ